MYSTTYNKEEKLWYGANIPPLYNPKVSIGQVLLNSMSMFGSKIAQVNREKKEWSNLLIVFIDRDINLHKNKSKVMDLPVFSYYAFSYNRDIFIVFIILISFLG